VALKATCIKNFKFNIFKIRTGYQYVLQQKPKLGRTKPSTGPHAARGLDIAVLNEPLRVPKFSVSEKEQ